MYLIAMFILSVHLPHVISGNITGYGQNGDRSKRRQVKTATNQNGYESKVNV